MVMSRDKFREAVLDAINADPFLKTGIQRAIAEDPKFSDFIQNEIRKGFEAQVEANYLLKMKNNLLKKNDTIPDKKVVVYVRRSKPGRSVAKKSKFCAAVSCKKVVS
jgi:hypothetical protein